jgi:CHAD domain-containing protein
MISDRDIHDARVSLKKARALLKLIRSQVEEDFWKREYETLRSSGRALCGLRESAVHRKVLKDIKKKKPAVFKKISNPAIEQLMRKPDRDQVMPEETLGSLEEIGSSLKSRISEYVLNHWAVLNRLCL